MLRNPNSLFVLRHRKKAFAYGCFRRANLKRIDIIIKGVKEGNEEYISAY
jgi:hypothetical protein